MPETIPDWVYYDNVACGTSGAAIITFFNQNEATAGKDVTNLPHSGQIPPGESFSVKEIGLFPQALILGDDVMDYYENAVVEILVGDKRKLAVPAQLLAPPTKFSFVTQDVDNVAVGTNGYLYGLAYKFERPIKIVGGESVKLKFTVGTTAASTSTKFYAYMRGELTRA